MKRRTQGPSCTAARSIAQDTSRDSPLRPSVSAAPPLSGHSAVRRLPQGLPIAEVPSGCVTTETLPSETPVGKDPIVWKHSSACPAESDNALAMAVPFGVQVFCSAQRLRVPGSSTFCRRSSHSAASTRRATRASLGVNVMSPRLGAGASDSRSDDKPPSDRSVSGASEPSAVEIAEPPSDLASERADKMSDGQVVLPTVLGVPSSSSPGCSRLLRSCSVVASKLARASS
mmetsp:Transcript_123492/g.349043  ORF Transcript_123492/g.349043 Transcript_123492/m.349043 type:complete len:230 (-) Transcript_123492:202-891(-)